MINKNIVALFFILVSTCYSYGQEVLTLKESVSGAYNQFYPENVSNMSWVVGEDAYYYSEKIEDGEAIMKVNVESDDEARVVDSFSMSKLLVNMGSKEINRFSKLNWSSASDMVFAHDGLYWNYNLAKKELTKISIIADGAENHDPNSDYSKIAFTIKNNLYFSEGEEGSLAITNNDEETTVSGQAIHRYEFGISKGTFWSPNGNSLAFYEKNESMVSDYPLLSYGVAPTDLNEIKYPMAGQASHQAKVGVYNTNSKKLTYLNTGPLDDHYLTNLTWSPDEKYIFLAEVNRDQNHMKLNKYDAKTGENLATLFEEKDNEYVEPEQGPIFLEGNNDDFLWYSERDGYNHLYRYNSKGELLNQVSTGNVVVMDILDYQSSTGMLVVSGTSKPTEVVAYQVKLKGGEMKLLTKDSGTHRVMVSSDGNMFLDNKTALNTTREISVRNVDGSIVKEIFKANNPLKSKITGNTELYSINADDGTDLWCRMIKPSNFDENKKYPVLVYVYGGPHAQMVKDTWLGGASLWMHYMAERGYIIFTLDNRGSANRGIEFEQAVHRNLGDLELMDQLAGVKHLKSLKYVDSSKMAIHGWSYGGFMTTSMMTRYPDEFKVGVAGGPVIDWGLYEIMYTERYMDTPQQNPDGFAKSNVTDYVSNLKGDLLLIHGSIDDVVVMQHSMEFLKRCVEEEKQVDFFVYPGHKHNVRGKDRVHLMTKVLNYVEDKLGTN
ncbi:MAG: dipeptidyl-peptidase-4 [Patiriisocius sp.]|jgi:dipeptidyl-peptidase-4